MASRARTQRRKKAYTEKYGAKLLEAFALQNLGLAAFCDTEPKWPGSSLVWRWMSTEDGFRAMVEIARERQLERMMYGSLDDLAQCDPTSGVLPGDGAAIVAKHKAVADISQKLASKMVPKRFCERLAVDLDANIQGAIVLRIDKDDFEEPTDGLPKDNSSKKL